MTIVEQVQGTKAQHEFLLEKLAQLEDAPSSLISQKKCTKNFTADLAKAEAEIKKLDLITQVERKEYENIKASVGRKFAARITGQKNKFEARQAKEEREYVQALENGVKERNRVSELKRLIQEAEKSVVELEVKAAEYEKHDKELHALYSKIFDGPTKEYPQDDVLEQKYTKAKEEHSRILETLTAERKANSLLSQACENMKKCRSELESAKECSTMDMWGGGTYIDAIERSSLASAQNYASLCQLLLGNAAVLSPDINCSILNELYIANGSILSDVVFDNVFTDMEFHTKIQDSAQSAAKCLTLLEEQELPASADRVKELSKAYDIAKVELAKCREELDKFRQAVFENQNASGTSGGGGGGGSSSSSNKKAGGEPPSGSKLLREESPPPSYE